MNHIQKHKDDCCGCTACASGCPKQAITMQADALGFKYPVVDEDLCIDCGLCVKVCQFGEGYEAFEVQPSQFFAFRNKNEAELMKSQSGAAFWTLAQRFIKDGGVVYGVGLDDDFQAIHKRVSTLAELEQLRGSKYVQSDVGNTFKAAKEDLKQGRQVLFSGTSCQIAGLKSFIGRHLRKQLYTLDIVCHGVPSPYIWRDYLDTVRKKSGLALSEVKFRDKAKGWSASYQSFTYGQGAKHFSMDYSRFFYSDLSVRENCFVCPYTNLNRVSDITVADFWGWKKVSDQFNDNKGVSLVLVNSPKGQKLLDAVRDLAYIQSVPKEACLQKNLQEPSERPQLRSSFEEDYQQHGYHYVAVKYFEMGFLSTVVRNIKGLIKKIIR